MKANRGLPSARGELSTRPAAGLDRWRLVVCQRKWPNRQDDEQNADFFELTEIFDLARQELPSGVVVGLVEELGGGEG
ncbi:MAG: hypothetical protein NUW13_11845, partial [candidate division KSB1 bacterium]|nr:hypothetical protein [candidate division KSB1 bacterium]